MPTAKEPTVKEHFFLQQSFVVLGDSRSKGGFPKLSYGNLKMLGKTLYPIDVGAGPEVAGDVPLTSLDALPDDVTIDGAIIELARADVLPTVQKLDARGIRKIWVHQGRDTPELAAFCREQGLELHTGSCAVMYTQQGFSYHSIHKWVMKLARKY